MPLPRRTAAVLPLVPFCAPGLLDDLVDTAVAGWGPDGSEAAPNPRARVSS